MGGGAASMRWKENMRLIYGRVRGADPPGTHKRRRRCSSGPPFPGIEAETAAVLSLLRQRESPAAALFSFDRASPRRRPSSVTARSSPMASRQHPSSGRRRESPAAALASPMHTDLQG
ncbi:uncharacterized protein LOC120694299 [Panicum virgatum]|uniref:uncharacterized protein LOC120694299 n=1 Tax=Panicum virgatum TaxID=38727 RepID=UPI0019D56546|nr:uncharacterized protein LOC120694299 [Panicum virgatum]